MVYKVGRLEVVKSGKVDKGKMGVVQSCSEDGGGDERA